MCEQIVIRIHATLSMICIHGMKAIVTILGHLLGDWQSAKVSCNAFKKESSEASPTMTLLHLQINVDIR